MANIQVYASIAPRSDNTIHAGPTGAPKHPPAGYKYVTNVTTEIGQVAAKLLHGDYGTETPFEIDGKNYLARVEPHPPNPSLNRWHKGVTIYEPINSARGL